MKENVLQHYRGYELFVKQLEEAVFRYDRDLIPQAFDFLGMDQIAMAEKYLGDRCPYRLFGGYKEAFSKRLIIGEYLEEKDYIVCLRASFNHRFVDLSHRDVMGAVFHLGITEGTFGDMWIDDDSIYLYCEPEISDFICDNLTKIARTTVQFEKLDHFPAQTFRFLTRKATVSSTRLDKITAALIGHSREKAQGLIRGEKVSVNYQLKPQCDYEVREGDIISVRGYGRYLISSYLAVTRNGNTVVEIKKYD